MMFLAFKHLFYRKRQSFFTLVGILFGTAAFVIISGFFLGFRMYLIDQLVSGDAHIKISKKDEKTNIEEMIASLLRSQNESISWSRPPNPVIQASEIRNPQGWLDKLKSNPEVTAVGFQLTTTVLLSKSGISKSASLVGTDIEEQMKITNIASKITRGNFSDLKNGLDLIVIGETLANDLGVDVGDILNVSSGTAMQGMKIVGIYSSGNRAGDRAAAYSSISTVQKASGQIGKINQISVKTKNYLNASGIAKELIESSKDEDKIESWDQANASFLSIFQTQDLLRFSTTTVLMIVAGFGIYNVLSMIILQKRRDIAILRSMGFDAEDVLVLFLLQGGLLGFVGSTAGVCIGHLICRWLENFKISGPMGSFNVSMSFDPMIYVYAYSLGCSASLIASYLPSIGAAKLTPIEIIRSGAE